MRLHLLQQGTSTLSFKLRAATPAAAAAAWRPWVPKAFATPCGHELEGWSTSQNSSAHLSDRDTTTTPRRYTAARPQLWYEEKGSYRQGAMSPRVPATNPSPAKWLARCHDLSGIAEGVQSCTP